MASTTVSMPDIAQSSNTPNFSHSAAVALPIKSSPYVLTTSMTTASPSQAPAIVGEPLGSPPITSSIEDSRLSDTVSPAVSLSDHGLAPIGNAPEDLDESVLEALRKQGDRLQVLKFADTMENLINERSATKPNPRGTLSSSSTYHRMLIHRCCTYYRLTVEVDHTTKSITMIATTESRIPSKRISELVPQEPVSRPAFKIMRRSTPEQRGKGRGSSVPTPSSASATDSTPSLDNSGSSETGSGSPPAGGGLLRAATETALDDEVLRGLGLPQQQSRSANGASTPRKTYEERRVEYELARNRIFSDYSQKEKEAVKLREDKEREREVRELHRQLAEEEEATGELGRNPLFVPGSFVNGAAKAPNRDQTGSVPTGDATPSPAPSTDAEITPVTYPTLYNPEGTGYDSASPRPFPTEAAPTAPASYENHPQPPYIQGAHPGYNGNQYPSYPLMGMAGVPPNMNAGHGMMIPPMGAYPPYPGMQPGQPHPPVPHGQMAPPNGMNMGQYPMYSQPLANGWADQRQGPPPGPYPSQPIPDPNSGAPDQGFGSHPRSIQQNPYWQPPHPGMGNTEMPPPQASVGRGPYPPPQSNVPPHGQNYGQPPPPQFYPPGMQQHQPHYPPQQAQQAFPPPPPPQPQHAPQYGPQYGLGQQQQQRLVPGSQQAPPRGLWNPTGGPIGGPKRGPFNNAARPPQQQHQHHNRVPGRDGQRAGVNRGPSMKDMRENKDYTGVASLIATPMSPASVRSRSRNSSISDRSVSRGPGAQLWPTDGLAPMPMRGTRPEFAGDRRRSGSLSGSVAESVSESGAVTPLDETASLASSTMSSASSTRTFTSTSSKHPSLPSRPDFPQGLPMHRMQSAGSNASRSSHSSVRGKSGSSSASHSRTQSFQSQGRPSPYAPATSDFPPLPSVVGAIGHMPNLAHPAASRPNNAWTGNTRTILMTNGPVPEYAQDQARQPQPNRFEEQDGKFSRPPAKPSVTLYDPKNPLVGKVGASIVVQAPAGEIDGRNAAAKQQDSEDQSKLLAARLEQLVVGEHSAGSGASAT